MHSPFASYNVGQPKHSCRRGGGHGRPPFGMLSAQRGRADVAQRQSRGLISPWSVVRVHPSAPTSSNIKPVSSEPQPQSFPTATHKGLEQRVLRRLKALGLSRDDLLVVGFSGGPDSLALASVLARLRKPGGFRLLLAHINHRLRPTADDDAQACIALADQLAVPIVVHELLPGLRQRHPGTGIEEAARRERYHALAKIAERHQAAALALAHQEDDQAETILLHLLRGTGLRGAAGMAEVAWITVPWWDTRDNAESYTVRVWRPLLPEPRIVVHNYIRDLGLVPVIDETNEDRSLRRNAIRHEALPVLERIVPGARSALARFAAIASAEDAFLEQLTEQALPGVLVNEGCLDGKALAAHPLALRRRILRLWLERQGVPSELGFDRLEAALAASRAATATIQLGYGWTLLATSGRLCVARTISASDVASSVPQPPETTSPEDESQAVQHHGSATQSPVPEAPRSSETR